MKVLKNPPIIEVLLQINYEPSLDITSEFSTKLVSTFAAFKSEPISQIQIAPNAQPVISAYGNKFSDASTGEVIQITKEFLAYSTTAKYDNWESFSKRGLDNVSMFLGQLAPANINRVALRYVNRIEIEDELRNVGRYLKVYPTFGEVLSNKIENSILQFSSFFSEYDARANIILRIDKTTDEKFVVFLDIDAFIMGQFKPTREDINIESEKLRAIKNVIFKDCLTEVLLASFN